jgi:hypothetical protein
MTTWTRPEPSFHLLLCLVAFAIGVLIFANVIHVSTLHAGVGLVIAVVAILSAL